MILRSDILLRWDSVERVCTNLETYIPEFELQLYQKEYEIREINFLKPYFSYIYNGVEIFASQNC